MNINVKENTKYFQHYFLLPKFEDLVEKEFSAIYDLTDWKHLVQMKEQSLKYSKLKCSKDHIEVHTDSPPFTFYLLYLNKHFIYF